VFAIHDGFRRFSSVVPKDADVVATEHHELISRGWVEEPGSQMLLVGKWFNLRWDILFINSPFPAILLDIREFVDRQSVFLVKSGSVKLFRCSDSLFWGLIFDKCKTVNRQNVPNP
jgi:hypothetical protein